MICNPALKNVLTYLGSADLQSAAKENAFPFVVLGDNITNHLRNLRHLRDFKSKPRICVNL